MKEVRIKASPETVFAFFTDPVKFTRWLCDRATVDSRPGGINHQTHPGDRPLRHAAHENARTLGDGASQLHGD